MLTLEKLFNSLDHSSDGVSVIDNDGTLKYVNKTHCILFGYNDSDELRGKHWSIHFNTSHIERMNQHVFPAVNKNGYWSGEVIGKKKDGSQLVQYISLTKIIEEGFFCICRDETKDLNLGRLEYMSTNLGKGIVVEDEYKNIVLINRQFCKLFYISYQLPEIIGANFFDFMAKIDLFNKSGSEFRSKIESLASQKYPVYEERIELSDNRVLEMDYFPIYIGDQYRGQLWSFSDVTQNDQLKRSLIEAKNRAISSEKAKSAFLSYMSHEIRTPMNAIIGFAEQLSFSNLNEQQAYFVKNITDAGSGLLSIINDILDLSKIEAGKMNIEKKPFKLFDVVTSVQNILKPKAAEKGLKFIIDYDNTINEIHFSDDVRIRQVLINIIGNAIKFTTKGSIEVSFKNVGFELNKQIIQFQCKDTGVGISKDGQNQLFSNYFQENRLGKSVRELGSGLGLAITSTIIEMLGGEIDVKSILNKGTDIRIKIPLEIYEKKEKTNSNHIVRSPSVLKGKKILLAEDNHLNRLVFKMMLNNIGVDVDVVENGVDALDNIRNNKYDLVLMDIQMPIMDGTTALYEIKKNIGEELPVIALTASALTSEVKHMFSLGFNDCITKPIDQSFLEKRLIDFFSSQVINMDKFSTIHSKIVESVTSMSSGDGMQSKKLYMSMLEEISFALNSWKDALKTLNWDEASKVLHRQKVMINSIGIDNYDFLIEELEDDTLHKSESEYKLMYSQLISLFQSIKERFSDYNS